MVIFKISKGPLHVVTPRFSERHIMKSVGGWRWHHVWKKWWTNSATSAAALVSATSGKIVDFDGPPEKAGTFDAGAFDLFDDAHESSLTTTDFIPPSPAGLTYLPFQRAGIEYALKKSHCLIGDEMGLGKTVQALGLVNCIAAKNVLILCPAALKMNWGEESRKWLMHGQAVTVLGMDKTPEIQGPGVFICNYEQIAKWQSITHGRCWDLLVLDEAQYLGNRSSRRTMATLGDAFGNGAVPAKKIVALSGTPISNRTEELFPLLRRMLPHKFRFFREFEDRYGSGQNLGELQMLLRDNCMVRRLKKQVLKELPEKWVRDVVIDCATPQAIEATMRYREAKKRYMDMMHSPSGKSIEEKEQSIRDSESAMRSALSAALKATVSAKMQAVGDFVHDAIETARSEGAAKVIVFTMHIAMADYLEKRFSERCVSLTGEDTNPRRRRDAVRSFQEDKQTELFIGNFKAAATGLTLTAANREIMAELHWNPAIMAQAEDRAHRIGQTRGVVVDYLVCKDTTDEDILRTIKRKRKQAAKALNQD